MPHIAGEVTPGGGGTWAPMVLNTWPMKPSGVQLAMAMTPPGRHTRSSSSAARWWSAVNMDAERRGDGVEAGVAVRQGLGVALVEPDRVALGGGALARVHQQRGHVVDADDVAPAPGGGDGGAAVAGGDVEHLPAGPQLGRLAELLAHDLQGGADGGVVAGRPGALLTGLDGGQVDGGGGRCQR